MKILLVHENHLGDVILSSGILPERLKLEKYPDSELHFMTSTASSFREGSSSTGWCLELIRFNPWIDQAEPMGPTSGYDLVLSPRCCPEFNQNVMLAQAGLAGLEPGRTDFRVYCSDQDQDLAERFLDGRKRPIVAVNMNLAAIRIRAWGEENTRLLCAWIEEQLCGSVVWVGYVDFFKHRRMSLDGRLLNVREQAAVLSRCDLHVCVQGAGANLSAAVGTQTLALTGVHSPVRESAAIFWNSCIQDPNNWHHDISYINGRVFDETGWRIEDRAWNPGVENVDESFRKLFHRVVWQEAEYDPAVWDREPFNRIRKIPIEFVKESIQKILHDKGLV